jgi:hypothetical protein
MYAWRGSHSDLICATDLGWRGEFVVHFSAKNVLVWSLSARLMIGVTRLLIATPRVGSVVWCIVYGCHSKDKGKELTAWSCCFFLSRFGCLVFTLFVEISGVTCYCCMIICSGYPDMLLYGNLKWFLLIWFMITFQMLYFHVPSRHPSSTPELELPTLLQVTLIGNALSLFKF